MQGDSEDEAHRRQGTPPEHLTRDFRHLSQDVLYFLVCVERLLLGELLIGVE